MSRYICFTNLKHLIFWNRGVLVISVSFFTKVWLLTHCSYLWPWSACFDASHDVVYGQLELWLLARLPWPQMQSRTPLVVSFPNGMVIARRWSRLPGGMAPLPATPMHWDRHQPLSVLGEFSWSNYLADIDSCAQVTWGWSIKSRE
jgi:hypothetical protein